MKAIKKISTNTTPKAKNSIGLNVLDRSSWVEQVLRIVALKYNLDDSDIEGYANKLKGRKTK